MTFFKWGATLAALAVGAGAFGAHGLEQVLTENRMDTYETAVQYHLYHALALLIVGALTRQWARIQWSGYCFIVGVFLFSGSLYLLVLTDTAWLGAITPLGGVAFIAGWLALAFSKPIEIA